MLAAEAKGYIRYPALQLQLQGVTFFTHCD